MPDQRLTELVRRYQAAEHDLGEVAAYIGAYEGKPPPCDPDQRADDLNEEMTRIVHQLATMAVPSNGDLLTLLRFADWTGEFTRVAADGHDEAAVVMAAVLRNAERLLGGR